MRRYLSLVCLALLASIVHSQEPPARPAFRAGVAVVEVVAVVTGSDDRSLTDLNAQDFQVHEDGKLRPIVSVRQLTTSVRSGVSSRVSNAPAGAHIERLATNADVADEPAFVLLLDDLNTSPYDTHRVIRAAQGALRAIPENGLVAVLTTSGIDGSLLTLSHPSPAHAERVRRFRGQMLLSQPKGKRLSPETAPSTVNAPCGVGSAVLQSQDCGDPTRAARRAGAVSAAAQILGRAGARRKVLFWITPDMGVSPLDPDGNRRAQRQALVQAVNNDVAVYAVDPRENITGVETENDGRPDRRTGGTYRVGPGDAPLLGSSSGGGVLSLDTDDMVAVPLTQLARETGGRFITAANDLETVLADVVEQNSTSYLVVYETSVSQTAGRHRIQLRVNRPGARVFARRGYVVDPAEASPAGRPSQSAQAALLTKTLMGSVPQGRVPLTMHVTPQFADGKQGRAGVTVAIGPLPAASVPVDLLIVSVDERGNPANQQQVRVPTPPPGEPWEITTEVPLSRGHHQLRVAAATADGAHTGLVLAEVEIVEPGRNLVMTPPVLLESSTGIVRPTAVRARQPGAPLALQVQVAGRPVEQKSVRVRASLLDAAGRSVRKADALLDQGAKSDRARATAVFNTNDVPAGEYLLIVEASAPGRASDVRHALPITLEPPPVTVPAKSNQGSTARQPRDMSTMAIGTTLLAHGPTSSHVAAPLVIRTEIAFAEFWKGLPTRQPPPPVDFERVALLAIVIETPAAAPRRPVVARVERGEDGVIVYWTTTPAEAHANLPPQAALRPFVVVAVTDPVGRMRFERVE